MAVQTDHCWAEPKVANWADSMEQCWAARRDVQRAVTTDGQKVDQLGGHWVVHWECRKAARWDEPTAERKVAWTAVSRAVQTAAPMGDCSAGHWGTPTAEQSGVQRAVH